MVVHFRIEGSRSSGAFSRIVADMRTCLRKMAEYFTEYDEDGSLKGSVWKTAFRLVPRKGEPSIGPPVDEGRPLGDRRREARHLVQPLLVEAAEAARA